MRNRPQPWIGWTFTCLAVPEQRKVLALVRTLRDQGVPVIIISHNLQDVFAVADQITILRRGRKVAELDATETTPDEIVSLMVGARAVHEMGVIPNALEEDNSDEGPV